MNSDHQRQADLHRLDPRRMLSAPRDGPTVRSSTKEIGAARAPARSISASSEDSMGLSRPVIWNWAPSATG